LIASLASFVWAATEPGVLHQLAANVVLMASITTILFNANPLMRFDGYYILSDALDVPNLYGQCQSWLRGSLRRRVLGLPTPTQQLPPRLEGFMRVYAIAALVWRLTVYAGIIIAAALLWKGAGVVLAALAVVTWFAIPCVRWVRATFLAPTSEARPDLARLAVVVGGGAALFCLALAVIPWPGAPASAAVVDYAPMWVLRAPTDAWIDRLFVESGQYVEQGAVLAELRNDDLELDAARLKVQIQRTELEIRRLDQERRHAEAQSYTERLRGLEKQLKELESQQKLLYVRALAPGRVVSPRVGDLIGTYAKKGQELLSIGDERRKEVLIAATQDDLDKLSSRVGQPVRIAAAGGESIVGRLERIKPRASTRPVHAALTATAGGPLTVQRGGQDSQDTPEDDVKLLQPYFEAVVPLAPDAAERLAAGQTVRVYLNAGRDSIAEHLWKSSIAWFRARTQ
jgi:putative peptide zinc metalloprotease protein